MKIKNVKTVEELYSYLKENKNLIALNDKSSNYELMQSLLKELTPHLSSTATSKERVYNILNDLTEVPLCVQCQKPLKFIGSKYKESYCDKHCHGAHRQSNLIEIRKNDPDWFKCEICGQYIKSVISHLSNINKNRKNDPHNGWTVDSYKEAFPHAQILSSSTRQRLSDMGKGQNNPNHSSKTTDTERKERSPYAIEFWRRKYLNKTEEEITLLWEDFHKGCVDKVTPTTSVQYYLNKGYSQEDADSLRSERQRTFTLEKCITKHGEEEGRRIHKERNVKWSAKVETKYQNGEFSKMPKSLNSCIYSNASKRLFGELLKEFPDAKCYFSEIRLKSNENYYCYDFTVDKKIIEFNGDYWHMNPVKYKESDYNINMQLTAKEKWEFDERKINLAKEKGYEVLIVWEKDFNDDKEKQTQKCIQFLRHS